MGISDDLRKKLEELELERSAREAVAALGGYVAARESEIGGLIERTAGKVDERTEHRYTETIDKVRDGLLAGVGRIAEQKDLGDGPDQGTTPPA